VTLGNAPMIVFKTALAVVASYALASEVTPRDVLSASFVAMLCISPTLYTGLRRGLAQLVASALGGLATLAVMIPLGVNAGTLGLSMLLGLAGAYVMGLATTLTVAGFTVLYVGLIGNAGVDAYFTRLASVLLGVGVGTLVNLIVSAFWYARIFGRRVAIASRAVERPIKMLADAVAAGDAEALARADSSFAATFRLLSELQNEFHDLRRELRLRKDVRGEQLRVVLQQQRIVEQLELIGHYGRNLALNLRLLVRDDEGEGDAASIDAAGALRELAAALSACAARLERPGALPPKRIRSRFDPLLRHAAARVAEGDESEERLELILAVVMVLDKLQGATAMLVDLVSDVRREA